MRTLKSKIILPIAVFMVAIAAAFATQAKDDNWVLEPGYIHASSPCEVAMECSPIFGIACTFQNKQVYGMNSASQCTRALYLPK